VSHPDEDDFDFEPIPGLPEELPEGEKILWQGAPNWIVLGLTAFKIGIVLIYFALLMVLRAFSRYDAGDSVPQAIMAAIALWPFPLLVLVILGTISWFSSKTTLYTITNRRLVLRIGLALSTTVNVPFAVISAAALRPRLNGTGDIPVTITGPDRLGYVHLWPHVRPWRFRTPEPMLRAVPNAAKAAQILSQALVNFKDGSATPPQQKTAGSSPAFDGSQSKAGAVA
jgi:hypothetical protein